ncbi:MAG TPA: NAD(P)-binding protein [Steroidobacteraceae bacterium]|jgi:spermidine dehydrogenase|nr:NAD(P)-binding protein [Steroidobacteraceae bacterium]
MNDQITRRDFMDGVACTIVAGMAPRPGLAAPSDAPYPPARTGYVGSRPQDFAIAHSIRDGQRYALDSRPVTERYDYIVIGSGIGGLAAAHYLRRARPKARILILDNHDEFGGHARRNEFNVGGRFLLGYGGSESLEGVRRRWSRTALDCIASIGVSVDRLEQAFQVGLYPGLGLSSGLFFPRETYGVDRLVTGDPVRQLPTDIPPELHHGRAPAQFLADCPIEGEQRSRLLALYTDPRDVLAGKSDAEKRRLLEKTSYHDYLKGYFGLDDRSLAMFDGRTLDLFAAKANAVSSLLAWECQYPGFQGLGLKMSREGILEGDPYIHHFPDGNATLARLFVRQLIPAVAPGDTMEDVIGARFDYSRLDKDSNDVRLRLSSTVVALGNRGAGADVLYMRNGELTRAAAAHVVYSGYSAMLPYICPDLGAEQRHAVADQVKGPLVYINVALRSWRSWVNRGVHYVNNPAGFYSHLKLDYPVSLGDYRFPANPDQPMILHLLHVPWPEGPIKDLRSAWRAGRQIAYTLPFDEFESRAKDELTRILGPGGFDAQRDLAAITVNRWGHGYAYDMDTLFDDEATSKRETQLSHQPLGRIHFAGTDAAWMAYAHWAMDSAHRAAQEILT